MSDKVKKEPDNKVDTIATVAEVLKILESIAGAKFTKKEFTVEEFKALPESAMSAIESIEVFSHTKDGIKKIKVKIYNQNKALKLIKKIKGR